VTQWLDWARTAGVHDRVLDFAVVHPDLFENADSNPRAWEGVSKLLHAGERDQLLAPPLGHASTSLLQKMIAGLVGTTWSTAFWQYYVGSGRPIDPMFIVTDYAAQRRTVAQWISQSRLDLLQQTLKMLQGHLQSQKIHDAVVAHKVQRLNVIAFVQDLPADLRAKWSAWVIDRAFPKLILPRKRS
jgi:hypothetical protein